MADWAEKRARKMTTLILRYGDDREWLVAYLAIELRQAAADARAQGIEKSADPIQRQAEPKDAT